MQPVVNKAKAFWNVSIIIIFILYLLYLFYLTLFSHLYGRGYFHRSMNLIPFRTIHQYLYERYINKIVLINLLGNIAAFVPMGCLLPLVLKKSAGILGTLLLAGGISLMIEVTQYIFGVGAADIDDLLLNLAGGLSGYALYKLAGIIYKK